MPPIRLASAFATVLKNAPLERHRCEPTLKNDRVVMFGCGWWAVLFESGSKKLKTFLLFGSTSVHFCKLKMGLWLQPNKATEKTWDFLCAYSVSTYLLVKMGNGTCTIFVLYSTYSIKIFEDHFRYLYFLWLQIGIQKKPGENGKTSIWKRWIWGFNLSHCHRAQDSTYIFCCPVHAIFEGFPKKCENCFIKTEIVHPRYTPWNFTISPSYPSNVFCGGDYY